MKEETASQARRSHHRSVKNYLLDRRFQLKYAGLLFGVAVALSLALGFLLYRTSHELVSQSRRAVASGQEAVTLARRAATESSKVSAVVRMNIVKDPVYKNNPELLAAFQQDEKKQDDAFAARRKAIEDQAAALGRQADAIAAQQRHMLVALLVLLALLAVGVGLAGIVVTHKVAGPIFKMTRQMRGLSEGRYRLPDPLRKGDELTHFFGAFAGMVESLRNQREKELALLAKAKDAVGDSEAAREPLEQLERELSRALEG